MKSLDAKTIEELFRLAKIIDANRENSKENLVNRSENSVTFDSLNNVLKQDFSHVYITIHGFFRCLDYLESDEQKKSWVKNIYRLVKMICDTDFEKGKYNYDSWFIIENAYEIMINLHLERKIAQFRGCEDFYKYIRPNKQVGIRYLLRGTSKYKFDYLLLRLAFEYISGENGITTDEGKAKKILTKIHFKRLYIERHWGGYYLTQIGIYFNKVKDFNFTYKAFYYAEKFNSFSWKNQYNLAYCYLKGIGVDINIEKGTSYFNKAKKLAKEDKEKFSDPDGLKLLINNNK